MASEEALFAKLETWVQAQFEPPNLSDVMQTGDADLIGAFVLKVFRAAARNAVTDRLEREGSNLAFRASSEAANAVMRVFDGLGKAWELNGSEKLALLGISELVELEVLRASPLDEITHETIGRVTILLDIFRAVLSLLPVPERANDWVRKPNTAPFFGGRSPMQKMLGDGMKGLGEVRAYLWAEVWSR
jgi:hypothetical protein